MSFEGTFEQMITVYHINLQNKEMLTELLNTSLTSNFSPKLDISMLIVKMQYSLKEQASWSKH